MKKLSSVIIVFLIICMFNIPVFADEVSVISEDFSDPDADYTEIFGYEDVSSWGKENADTKTVDNCPLDLGVDDDGVFCAHWINGRVLAVLADVMPRGAYIFTADICASGASSGFAIRQTNGYDKIIEDNKSGTGSGAMGSEGICFLMDASLATPTLRITVQQKSTDAKYTMGVLTVSTPITLPAGAEINPAPTLTPIKVVDNGTSIIAYIKDIKVATIDLSDLTGDNYSTAVIKDSAGTVLQTVSDVVIPTPSEDDSYMAFLNRTDYFLVDNFMLYSSDGTNDGTTITVATPAPATPTIAPTPTPASTPHATATQAKSTSTASSSNSKSSDPMKIVYITIGIVAGVAIIAAVVVIVVKKKKK